MKPGQPETRVKLDSSGPVSLWKVTLHGISMYWVVYPAKFRGTETSQFFDKGEAKKEYTRYALFFQRGKA